MTGCVGRLGGSVRDDAEVGRDCVICATQFVVYSNFGEPEHGIWHGLTILP